MLVETHKIRLAFALLALVCASAVESFADQATKPSSDEVGERVPSEDPALHDFHSLGLIDGRVNIFRCASPVRDLGVQAATTQQLDQQADSARQRMKYLEDLGIRTIVCLEDPSGEDAPVDPSNSKKIAQLRNRLALEKSSALEAGIRFVSIPMRNAGPHSLETMTDAEVLYWLKTADQEILHDAQAGGVLFHCSAGHDRTGMVAAFIRLKEEHWSVDATIEEMRRLGHNWVKYSHNNGKSSWHEDHLRAVAKMLNEENSATK